MKQAGKRAFRLITVVFAICVVSAGVFFAFRWQTGLENGGESSPQIAGTPGMTFKDKLLWGMPNKDLYPSMDSPRYVSRTMADAFLRDEDRVYLIREPGTCYAMPEVLLASYHVVNDIIGGRPEAITFCFLAGTACRFSRRIDDHVLTFGITGQLYGGNSVLYDKETQTDWLQLNGEPLRGPLHGRARLDPKPMECTTWNVVRKDEGVKVLAPVGDVGEYRTFQHDMQAEELGQKVVGNLDARLLPYTKGIGIRVREATRFYPKEMILKRRIINDDVGGWSIVVFRGADEQTRVFRRILGDSRKEFFLEDGVLKDRQTGSTWSETGLCTGGPLAGAQLEVPFFTRVYWFAWSSIYPQTGLL